MTKDILKSNFFELFDHPVSCDVDLKQIQQQYIALQEQVHPDKFANASDQEKRLSMQQTSWINEAQATLKDPVLRAIYLLKLKGLDINLENETTMDMDFLMHQLEIRETLENVKNRSNPSGEPFEVLDGLSVEVKTLTETMMSGFATAYQQDKLDDAREWIRKLQFMQKAKKEINMLIADLEDEMMR